MSELKKVKIGCQDCDSTGLHVGQLEGDGTATLCATCQGKGYIDAEYEPFKKRKKRTGVKKVFQSAFGCPIYIKGQAMYELEDSTQIEVDFDKYDCSYKEWLNGEKTPIVLQELSCPLIASSQDIKVVECMGCTEHIVMGTPIGLWDCYKDRSNCWEKYNIVE